MLKKKKKLTETVLDNASQSSCSRERRPAWLAGGDLHEDPEVVAVQVLRMSQWAEGPSTRETGTGSLGHWRVP